MKACYVIVRYDSGPGRFGFGFGFSLVKVLTSISGLFYQIGLPALLLLIRLFVSHTVIDHGKYLVN